MTVRHYGENDSIFLDNDYLIKGVAGSILWTLLRDYSNQQRTEFTNRELRLDSRVRLPDFSDNLEARLLLLGKRLTERNAGILIEKAGRGRMLTKVMGRSTGYCKGKSGSLHISAKELGVILTSTIVGGELSLATGVGLSMSMLGEKGIVACFFGDGAACEDIFHESLNLAAVWNLPILYICENNQWQAFVHRKETMTGEYISEWAKGYGMESRTVDGNDVEAVYAATSEALARIRATGKPYFLETWTYRLRGHYEPDDQSYVDPQELATWRTKDPIANTRQRLLDRTEITPADLAGMEERIAATVERAVAFAADSPFPAPAELVTDVYA